VSLRRPSTRAVAGAPAGADAVLAVLVVGNAAVAPSTPLSGGAGTTAGKGATWVVTVPSVLSNGWERGTREDGDG